MVVDSGTAVLFSCETITVFLFLGTRLPCRQHVVFDSLESRMVLFGRKYVARMKVVVTSIEKGARAGVEKGATWVLKNAPEWGGNARCSFLRCGL